ncbi:MAG: IclR family transcriptional regulator [Burkholderiales bacterium]|nr:IclR family transcriptional regulator [Burkholderiales bacterium]
MISRNHLIASAAATLRVLEVLGNAREPLTLAAIVEAMDRPKGSVHRMLATLVNTGFAVQDPETARYALTMKLWRLGTAAVRDLEIVKVARPWQERLVATTDETVHLAILDPSGDVIYISKVESPRSIRVQTQIGQLSPSWCTATGRSMLAFNPSVAARVLSQPLEPRTVKTVTDVKKIRASLDDVATKGYAVTKSENHPEMGGIAAPIRDHTGGVIAACGVAIPVFRMDRKLIDRCIPEVVRTAEAISAELGYQHPGKGRLKYGT